MREPERSCSGVARTYCMPEQPTGLPDGVYTVECSVLLAVDIIQHQYAEPSSKSRDGVVDQGDVPMRLRARGCSDQNVVS